ncbi:hypothetical protein MJO28_002568 [Puccinia striiformis f. sp. tritici]|uniref:Uncharacterized protein n=1 Tax=Puccinia striiformis f. sp. tritici TaxID=168172 RepID=A0ACC0ESG7_9BASI|nr:hypothetical protein Pst134EB_006549 [Puccinia striiformis f. sp. tritici]KAI7958777.1 hypothetical protein MJO28_002568 [Puccinia striiformis f. sp. tritici]KAI9628725.1 hypothetical protein KEM48_011407 [Puccinia striiformis f. sp. tritici PST-130]
MGKLKSASKKDQRHHPLGVQLRDDQLGSGKLSAPGRRQKRIKPEEERKLEIDDKTSKKILEIAKEQQQEILLSDGSLSDEEEDQSGKPALLSSRPRQVDMDSDSDDEFEGINEAQEGEESDGFDEEIEVDEGDQAILDSFRSNPSRNLADLILQKLEEHEDKQLQLDSKGKARQISPPTDQPGSLNPKIIEVYTKVGQLLSRYKSGPLPKAFKILPSLKNWFQILELTSPESWTPHATLSATKIFASNLDPRQCQKFYKFILYEKVRDEIDENKKLSVQLYLALKKSIYKPAAFFKGILFPLCESGSCTLKEAVIIGSILTKVSIPVLHSGAALLKLSAMEYTGPTSVFIRVLLDKKYALPYKVIDGLVFHFLSFKKESRQMPVLWHQSFLVFVQRYKSDLTSDQKDALLDLLKFKNHPLITQEIRREIMNSVARGEEILCEDVEML